MTEKIKYKGYKIEIIPDEYAENPREWGNIGKCIFFGKHSYLGDEHEYNTDAHNGWEEMEAAIIEGEGIDILLPVYGYSHGNLTINTTGYSCPWDSGQLGFIIVSRQGMDECKGWKRITEGRKPKLYEALNSEIKILDQYAQGDIWGFEIKKLDAPRWGYYGQEAAIEEAKAIIDYHVQKKVA